MAKRSSVSDAMYEEVLAHAGTRGLESGLPDEQRFVGSVATCIRACLAQAPEVTQAPRPTLFVLSPETEWTGKLGTRKFLVRTGDAPIGGRVFLANLELDVVYEVPADGDSEALLAELAAQPQFAGAPAVLYNPGVSHDTVLYFRTGLTEVAAARVEFSLFVEELPDPDEIVRAVRAVHEQSLSSPGGPNASTVMWANGKPIRNAEKAIQRDVRAAIKGRFQSLQVTEEAPVASGRYDIGIVRASRGLEEFIGIIELKVLRKRNSASTVLCGGIEQAFGYATDKQASWAHLYAFDMKHDEPSAHVLQAEKVVQVAEELRVRTEYFHMFATTEMYRAFLVKNVRHSPSNNQK